MPDAGHNPLDDYVGYALRRAQIAVFEEFIREFEPLDLRPAQFSRQQIANVLRQLPSASDRSFRQHHADLPRAQQPGVVGYSNSVANDSRQVGYVARFAAR